MQRGAPRPATGLERQNGHLALSISLIYIFTASLYILLSDRVLAWLIPDADTLSVIQSAKGLAFVLTTTAVLYLVLRRELRRYDAVTDALRDSMETLQGIIDAAPVSIIALDREGRVMLWNPASEHIFGWTAEEALGQLNPIVPPDRTGEFQGYMAALLAEGKGLRGTEVRRLHKSGAQLDISLSTAPVRDQAGQVVGVIGLHEDITDRKRSQAALRESEARFRLLFEANPQPMWVYDEETLAFIEVNEAALVRYGYSRDEFLSMTIKDIHPEEDVPRLIEFIAGSRRPALNPAGSWRHRLKDGTIIYVDIVSHSIDLEGRRARLVVAHDVTRRVQAEEQTERRSRELAALLTAARRLIRQTGLRERLQIAASAVIDALPAADSAALWLYDAARGELVMRTQAGIATMPAGLVASTAEGVPGRVFRRCQALILDDAQQEAGGGLIPEGARALLGAPLLHRGQAIGVLLALSTAQQGAFTEDDLRLLEALAALAAIGIQNARYFQQLREMSARLSEVETSERRRLSRELHDQAGQTLTALGINLNIVLSMLSEGAAPAIRERLTESLALVETATERIRDVMANLRPSVLDDYGLVAALRWHGERFARLTGIAFSLDGEEPEPRLAPAVEDALYRITQEALTNAARHAQASRVAVHVETIGGRVRLTITDDGIGFERDRVRRLERHPGWGLATMIERAELFGGTCRIESAPGQGTRITVEVGR